MEADGQAHGLRRAVQQTGHVLQSDHRDALPPGEVVHSGLVQAMVAERPALLVADDAQQLQPVVGEDPPRDPGSQRHAPEQDGLDQRRSSWTVRQPDAHGRLLQFDPA